MARYWKMSAWRRTPIGSTSKAFLQAAMIHTRNPSISILSSVLEKTSYLRQRERVLLSLSIKPNSYKNVARRVGWRHQFFLLCSDAAHCSEKTHGHQAVKETEKRTRRNDLLLNIFTKLHKSFSCFLKMPWKHFPEVIFHPLSTLFSY